MNAHFGISTPPPFLAPPKPSSRAKFFKTAEIGNPDEDEEGEGGIGRRSKRQ